MSRRTQDIPIRPRYGLTDEELEEERVNREAVAANTRSRKTSTNSNSDVASSYKEIPFLAQYAGAVPDSVLNDLTPTASRPVPGRDESLDDEEDEDNSKSSSCDNSNKTPKRPQSLLSDAIPYELEGADDADGQMRHFVAENLEEKLRLTSPPGREDPYDYTKAPSHHSTPSTSTGGGMTRQFLLMPQLPQIDANVLNDIEIEAQYLATSVDNLTENLCNLLHSISSITADNVEVHKNAVNKLTDSMDANIKCMYTIMAKTEEITKSMQPTEQVGLRIREIKRLVDMLDSTV
ncbi:BLOC-1-related complex subunit 6 [Lucilia cuprina]|uniref:BLOC-1-related complex subunit 6 n=1 Tax=Lucilia cuprina TaxID=7375 RepID=UPI001F064F08|nr:BLOC-1-related complex subunit 6 [Lucilia cuprina]